MSLFVIQASGRWPFGEMRPLIYPRCVSWCRQSRPANSLLTIGLVLQELLQGFSGPRARERILDRFSALPLLVPNRSDHIDAAELRNTCRRGGIQIGTIDALLAQLCLRHNLTMLTSDGGFRQIARHCVLKLWTGTT